MPAHRCLRLVPRGVKRAAAPKSPFPNPSRNLTTFRHDRHHPAFHSLPLFHFLIPAYDSQAQSATHVSSNSSSPVKPSTTPFCRPFSTTPPSRATVVTANPRKDEDGNDMTIDITPRASRRLREIMAKDSNPSLALRITVESGGCHGFQYLMSLTNTSAISSEDDTVFEARDGSGAKVVMDEPSLELLKGSKVDYTMELIGSQFKIVGNPAATSSCGCGTSFDIKA
ncbi:[4Fe-4S] proteins maturation [Hypocenomyce scalaris]|nr:[4Fe-4S] proteins maturation [Hypocenomyce scalaris]